MPLTGRNISANATASKHPPARINGRRLPIFVLALSLRTPISGSLIASHISEIRVTTPASAGASPITLVKKKK